MLVMSAALILPVLSGCTTAPAAPAPASPVPAADTPTVPDIPTTDAGIGNVTRQAVVAPVRVQFERLGISMQVVPEALDARGGMGLPSNSQVAGWYRFSPGLRQTQGATVLAAHIDAVQGGIGPFSRLKNAVAGDSITLTGDDGSTAIYTVTELRQIGKIDAPMAEVFDVAGPARLMLVTCGGVFNAKTGHYLDNVIVTATPLVTP